MESDLPADAAAAAPAASAVPAGPASATAAGRHAGAPRPPSVATLAARQTLRDLRAGELRLLALAVLLAVAALTAVGFFADRMNAGLTRDARQLIGGDAVLSSDQPLPPAFAERAAALGLASSASVQFPSMARARDEQGGASRLVSVKAVGSAYPLRGRLQIKDGPDAVLRTVAQAPAPGTVWVDPGVLDALQLRVGDPLLLGDTELRIAALIVLEPDRGAGFLAFSPRVMLAESDLAATALVQPSSRVQYRFAVAARGADEAPVDAVARWAAQRIDADQLRGVRLESLQAGRPEMGQALERGHKFLNLVALLAALLAAVAVGIAARDFASRHLDDCAMLRVLGLSQRRIAAAYALEFGAVGVLGSAAGVALGFAVHHVFVWLLAGLVDASLPPAGAAPALFGLGVGLTLLLAFGLPPVLQLARVPPLRVIRRDLGQPKAASLAVLGAGGAGFVALLLAVAGDPLLGAVAIGGVALAVALFALLSWLAVRLLRRAVAGSGTPPRWLVLATRQLAARPAFAVLQVTALAVGLLALVLLVLLRTDLIASWRQATPPDAPDRFVINVQPDQAQAFQAALKDAGVQRYDWYPMIRGRLTTINGQAVNAERFADERARHMVEREFNLSHDARLPAHNRIVAGRWSDDEAGAISVEQGLAKDLGLALGDTLGFDVAGIAVTAKITSLRAVNWGSMRVNFFVIFPRAQMPELPLSYISAFRAPDERGFDNRLVRAFPNITSVDISASIAQLQQVLDQVVRAVEFLFGFTLLAGLVVLFAAVSATREARAREYAVMRALGAGSRLLAQVQRAELLGVGALAGVLASLAAMAVGWALARWVFQFAWNPQPWVPAAGALTGALLALGAGWWGLREVLNRPVVQTLRRAAD